MRDLTRRLSGDRGYQRLQSLAQRVPGFAGYASKDLRREADRLLRLHVSGRLLEQRRKLEDLQAALVRTQRFTELSALEGPVIRLQTLADDIRTTSYGYAGWFDAATVEEGELEAIYQFDLSLAQSVDWVAGNVEGLSAALTAADGEGAAKLIADLNVTLDRLTEQMQRRRSVIIESKRPPAISPRQAFAAQTRRPDSAVLPVLQLNDAITHAGVDYLVAGRVRYEQGGNTWWAYMLRNGEERWLWASADGVEAYLATAVPVPEGTEGKATLEWEGEQLTLAENGIASAEIEGPSGKQSGLSVDYRRYKSTTGRILWLERWDEEYSAYLGDPVSPEELDIWQRPK
jgi:hypothetical protein